MMGYYNSSKELFTDEKGYEYWCNLVAKTRKEIEVAINDYRVKHNIKCYLYNKDGQLVNTFLTKKDCTTYLESNETTVASYLKNKWNFKGFLLSLEPLDTDAAIAKFNDNLEHGNVYLEGSKSKRMPIYCYNDNGKLVSIFESKTQWSKKYKKGVSFLRCGDRVYNERLISTNKYSEEKALEVYKKLAGVI